jgi:hypothetical protein
MGGRIILTWIKEVGWGAMDWAHLVQDRDKWPDIVNVVINPRGA